MVYSPCIFWKDWSGLLCAASTCLMCFMVSNCGAQETSGPWQANPKLVEKSQVSRAEFNYDESKVPEFNLPDALRTKRGELVTTAIQWTSERRKELLELFRDQVYGRRPDTQYTVQFEQTEINPVAFGGAATGKSMLATISIEQRKYSFPFVFFVPNKPAGKTPAVVLINNRYFVPLDKACSDPDPFWPVQTLIEHGYATASFFTSDVDPDRADGYAEGVRSFFANGQAPTDDAWRSLSAWGWAASKIVDFLEQVDSVDAKRVAIVGHSRGGKTALWAACEDQRFAIAYSNNSGCGGAALSRRAYGETVQRITTSFPHWFCKNFSAYGGHESNLPVDQHEVMGLIAPRAVYVTSADEDLWADPKGEYAALVAASPVFKLLGQDAISEPLMPALGQPRVSGKTGYHIRSGGHGLEEVDWNFFLEFCDKQWK